MGGGGGGRGGWEKGEKVNFWATVIIEKNQGAEQFLVIRHAGKRKIWGWEKWCFIFILDILLAQEILYPICFRGKYETCANFKRLFSGC